MKLVGWWWGATSASLTSSLSFHLRSYPCPPVELARVLRVASDIRRADQQASSPTQLNVSAPLASSLSLFCSVLFFSRILIPEF